jgi:acyl dehydratase
MTLILADDDFVHERRTVDTAPVHLDAYFAADDRDSVARIGEEGDGARSETPATQMQGGPERVVEVAGL